MRVNIYCCLLACALGCHVSADLFHKVVEERQVVILHCRQPVKNKVTWSRERDGRKVDILTIDGDRDIKHINDSGKRFNSQADKSLHIARANVSDSGKYLCDDEEAVELTVIPSGTRIHNVTERTSFSLNCSHDVGGSHDPRWRREMAGKEKTIRSDVSTESRSLIFTEVGPGDSGLYYCDGKPAGYLNVTTQKKQGRGRKGTTTTTPTTTTTTEPTTTTTPPTTTTTTTTSTPTTTPTPTSLDLWQYLVFGAGGVIIVLIIVAVFFTQRRRLKRQESEIKLHVYEEIPADRPPPTNGVQLSAGQTAVYYSLVSKGGSNQNDPTYATISELPVPGHKSVSPYCLVGAQAVSGRSNEGLSPSNPYSLLQKPTAAEL